MLLWILVAVLIALIWGASILASFFDVNVPLEWRIGLSVAVIVMALGWLVFRRIRAQFRAKALEQELIRQSQQHAAMARPDRREDIVELQRQIQQGIESLKDTKLGKNHGRAALYLLPWYAIIGPPGAGKTTALRHSGLTFPFMGSKGGGALKGVGGTRNCDWWFTNDGILLDTAGRYAVQEDDHDEWLAFLGALRRFRSKKPLNGLIVAVSISDLIQSNHEQIVTVAHQLRARLDEIITKLDVVLPVYLMFTKTDLVGGFVEFWGDLRKGERDQLLGATLVVDRDAKQDAGEVFEREFDRLLGVLHSRAVRIIGDERRPDARAKLLQFPGEFRALRGNLTEFTRRLFEANSYQESPLFRGFYFTSGTQEGRPFERVIDGMARAFGLKVPPSLTQPPEPKSYFVTDLFKRVVFPDQDLAVRTAAEQKRQQWIRWGIVGAAALLAALIAFPALASFINNQGLVRNTTVEGQSLNAIKWQDKVKTGAVLPPLDAVLDRLLVFGKYDAEGVPWKLSWGMYAGDELKPAVRASYLKAIDSSLVRESRKGIERDLQDYATKTANQQAAEYAVHYDKLKLYLMMSEPQHEHLDQEWATEQLTDIWVRERGDSPAHEALFNHVKYYVRLFGEDADLAWKRDEPLINRTRELLMRVPLKGRLYNKLIQDAEKNVPPIKHADIFYGSPAEHVSPRKDVEVSGAYTKEGWKRVEPKLEALRKDWEGEAWVLGPQLQETKIAIQKAVDKVEEAYFQDYQNAWRDFLMDIEVDQPQNTAESLSELRALSEPEWPYLRLLRVLRENISLDPPPQSDDKTLLQRGVELAEGKIEQKTGQKDIKLLKDGETKPPKYRTLQEAFEPLAAFAVPKDPNSTSPTGLSHYMESVARVVAVLDDQAQRNSPGDTDEVGPALVSAIQSATELATSQTAFTRPMLTRLLMPPLHGSFAAGNRQLGSQTGGLWSISVWEAWKTDLKPYYPFNPKSAKDVSMQAFADFFRPESGALWAFYGTYLKGGLQRTGDDFIPAERFNSSVPYTNGFRQRCLGDAAKITDALFPQGSEAPKLNFEVNLHSVSPNVSNVEFRVDGAVFNYKNTPEEWQGGVWPATEGDERGGVWRVSGINKLDAQMGLDQDFGFIRLLESGKMRPAPSDSGAGLIVGWPVGAEQMPLELDLRTKRVDVPELIKLFRSMDCPRIITGG